MHSTDQTGHENRLSIRRRIWVLAGLIAGALAVGCAREPNSGQFEISDIRKEGELGECLEDAFPLNPTFYAARERIDSVGLFVQTRARIGSDADLVYIEMFEPGRVRDGSKTAFSFGGSPSGSTSVRAEVHLGETCPRQNAALRIEGRAQFDSLRVDPGDRVVGELMEGTLLDGQTGETVAGTIEGRWDFAVQTGSPYSAYPTFDDDEYRIDP